LLELYHLIGGGHHGHSRNPMVVEFATTCAFFITTKVMSSNPAHGEVYNIM